MQLSFRSIRAAGSALVVAAAVGAGGLTGMESTFAAEPGHVALAGTLVDGDGHPLAGVQLTIEEELPPDGGIAAFPVTTGADGAFGADVFAWGTAQAPASVTVSTPSGTELTVERDSCSQTWSVVVSDARQLALADAAPDPLTVTATTTLLGEVCSATGTPGGTGATDGGGGAGVTPPPTDVSVGRPGEAPERLGPALTLGFAAGLFLATAFLLPRPGSRRRR